MKRPTILYTAILLIFTFSKAQAQWNNNGSILSTTDIVGIGTSTPLAPLHIKHSDSGITPSNIGGLFIENGGSANGYYVFQTATVGGGKSFSITNAGNVGIGTTSPDSRLTVKGHIHTQEVKVDLNGAVAPDYVFEESYSLPSLEATEAYIQANKHLPEVPSAKEMEANGIELKEMNLLMLKKMEEMTLHVIRLNKEMEALKGLVTGLQEENEKLKEELEVLKER